MATAFDPGAFDSGAFDASNAVSGTSAVSDKRDTTAASGTVITAVTGTSAVTDQRDTTAASGLSILALTGTSAVTDQRDTSAAVGSTYVPVTGTSDAVDKRDRTTASGVSRVPVTSTSALVDLADRLIAFGGVNTASELVTGSSSVVISVDGTPITDRVVIASAEFQSSVNGVPGVGRFRVRDLVSSDSFTSGQDVLVTINGQPVWRGWIRSIKRAYIAPAHNVSISGLKRFWDIEAVDVNLLFRKRYTFNQSDGAVALGPSYPAYTPDTIAIRDLVAGWLDLSLDQINTSARVTNVGDINADQTARPWQAGMTFGEAMTSIGSLPGAVYYLRPALGNPRAYLTYTDADTVNAPFGLSDTPDGTTTKGYREMEIIGDGANLANDVLAWGVGYGSTIPVFKREQSPGSIATHDRWQQGVVTSGVYKQATVDRIAYSIVYGSPTNHRGAKDDRMSVLLTTFEPGLLPGDKVTFTSGVHDYSDVIPIRSMRLTFVNPTTPRYELTLSHEIDLPWSSIDPFLFNFNPPIFPSFTLPGITMPGITDPSVTGCSDAICGITDSFTRDIPAIGNLELYDGSIALETAWGASDAGPSWFLQVGSSQPTIADTFAGIENGAAYIHFGSVFGAILSAVLPITVPTAGFTYAVRFKVDFVSTSPSPEGWDIVWLYSPTISSGSGFAISTLITNESGIGEVLLSLNTGSPDGVSIPKSDWVAGTWYNLKADVLVGATAKLKIWEDGEVEPDWYGESNDPVVASSLPSPIDIFTHNGLLLQADAPDIDTRLDIDYIDISGVNRCTAVQFDDFNRVVSNGWGISDSGSAWTVTTSPTSVFSVDGESSVMTASSGSPSIQITDTILGQSAWVMRNQFTVGSLGSGIRSIQYRFIGPDLNRSIYLNLSTSSGSLEIDTASPLPFNFASSTYGFSVSWDETTGEIKAKVWIVGDAEPDWMLSSFWGPGSGPMATLSVGMEFLSASYTHRIDYIDFDYDGKPCCDGFITDQFSRTVSGTWDGGYFTGYQLAGTTAQQVAAINGTQATLTNAIGDNRGIVRYGVLPSSLSYEYPIQFLAGFTLPANTGLDGGTHAFDFIMDYSDISGSPRSHLIVSARRANAFGINNLGLQVSAQYFLPGDDPSGGIRSDRPSVVMPGDYSTWGGIALLFRAEVTHTTARIKLWKQSTVEPSTWNIDHTLIDPGSMDQLVNPSGVDARLGLTVFGNGHVASMDFYRLSVAGCAPQPAISDTSSDPTGYTCENPVRIDATNYRTSSAYQSGSVTVWKNGLRLIQEIDWAEDIANQRIVFSADVLVTDVIRACYLVSDRWGGV